VIAKAPWRSQSDRPANGRYRRDLAVHPGFGKGRITTPKLP